MEPTKNDINVVWGVGAMLLNDITRRLTAFDSFMALLLAEGNYRPTIHVKDSLEHLQLAEAYDKAQQLRGDARRAYRGD